MQRVITGISIGAFAIGANAESRSALWRMVLLGLIAVGTTVAAAWFGAHLVAAAFGGFMFSAVSSAWLITNPPVPPELRPPAKTESERPLADLALRAAGWLQRFAQRHEEKKP